MTKPAFNLDFTDLAQTADTHGRGDCQWGWYDRIREPFAGLTLLDVGTGISRIKERMPECQVTTHEACADLPADRHGDLALIHSNIFNAVTAFDVIEHVVEYGRLIHHLARIANRYVFVTTPGAEASQGSPFHFHELHPWELVQTFEAAGMHVRRAWATQWDGAARFEKGRTCNVLKASHEVTRGDLLTVPNLHPVGVLFEHGGSWA